MDNASLRRFVYTLLLVVTAGAATARVIGVELVYEPSIAVRPWPAERPEKMPTFSSNDRSRWATIRALVENGTFVVGKRIKDASAKNGYRDEGIAFEPGYGSVDYIKDPDETKPETDFFSSKPPLFTMIAAGEYWLLNRGLGWTLTEPQHRWPVVCTILITFNVLPLIVFLVLLAKLLEEFGTTDWGRLFVFAAACFGTFLTTFAVTLNNHGPAAYCVLFAVYPLLRRRAAAPAKPFSICGLLVSGFFAGLALTFDLPAAAFAAVVGLICLLQSGVRVLWFLFAALIPIAALLTTNDLAIGDWQPAYSKFGGPWYEYEGSHWDKATHEPNVKGIDFIHEPKEIYALHLLIGHHGLFSLTPIWLFAVAGMLFGKPAMQLKRLNNLAIFVTAVVIAFYVWNSNNYGGWTSGPRWFFWLTPLFLLAMLPAADWLGRWRAGRGLAYLFLGVSVFSAAYPVWNPWRHPWIYQLCEYMNWVSY
jgi:hypothetical protein